MHNVDAACCYKHLAIGCWLSVYRRLLSRRTLYKDYVRDWISLITEGKYQLPCKDEITTIIDDLYSECLQRVLTCKSSACVYSLHCVFSERIFSTTRGIAQWNLNVSERVFLRENLWHVMPPPRREASSPFNQSAAVKALLDEQEIQKLQ